MAKPFYYLYVGDWRSFEPLAALAERYVDAFTSSTLPHLRQLAEIIRKSV